MYFFRLLYLMFYSLYWRVSWTLPCLRILFFENLRVYVTVSSLPRSVNVTISTPRIGPPGLFFREEKFSLLLHECQLPCRKDLDQNTKFGLRLPTYSKGRSFSLNLLRQTDKHPSLFHQNGSFVGVSSGRGNRPFLFADFTECTYLYTFFYFTDDPNLRRSDIKGCRVDGFLTNIF